MMDHAMLSATFIDFLFLSLNTQNYLL